MPIRDWKNCLSTFRDIDWLRSNTGIWEGRAMIGGQMSKARQNIQLTANVLKTTLGLTLTQEEVKFEEKYRQGGSLRHLSSKVAQPSSKK